MRKIYVLFSIIFILSSCYEDLGNYNYTERLEIKTTGMDSVYSINAYETIRIDITAEPADLSYEYTWGIYQLNVVGYAPKVDTIGKGKSLAYEVALPTGEYVLLLFVKDIKSQVTMIQEAKLHVKTELSEGWWLLKDENGYTEFDRYDGEKISSNIIRSMNEGYKLKGDAQSMYYTIKFRDYDPATKRYIQKTVIFALSTEDIIAFTIADGKIIREFDKLFFTAPTAKRPNKVFGDQWSLYLVNDGKVHTIDLVMPNQGVFGYKKSGDLFHNISDNDITGDAFSTGGNPILFDNLTKSFCTAQVKETHIQMWQNKKNGGIIAPPVCDTESELLMIGARDHNASLASAKNVFTLLKKKNEFYLTKLPAFVPAPFLNPIIQQDTLDNSLNIAKASHWTTNLDADVLYYAKGNEIYSYNIASKKETAQNLGIPSDEVVTYMEHIVYRPTKKPTLWFDYLVIATEVNGTYKIYRHKILSENLDKESLEVLSGSGRIKKVFYRDLTSESLQF